MSEYIAESEVGGDMGTSAEGGLFVAGFLPDELIYTLNPSTTSYYKG